MTKQQKESFLKKIQRDFIYGLLILIPIIVTFWFVGFCIDLISIPGAKILGADLPKSYGVFLSVFVIFFTGVMTRNFIGSFILKTIDDIFFKIPVINKIYRSIKHIVGSFGSGKQNFTKAVLVEYPRKGLYSIGFVTRDNVTGLMSGGEDMGKGKVAVFLPSTPNPTSGFFVYVDASEVKELALPVEDSIKILMSAGLVDPSESGNHDK